jgi:carboxypeptidase Q
MKIWSSFNASRRFAPRLLLAGALCYSVLVPRAHAQNTALDYNADTKAYQAYRTDMETADQKIADEIKVHSELVKNLEYLSTQIGPRLTGSPQMQKASQWTLQRFQDYKLDAHLESTEVPHAYYRGDDSAEILTPVSRLVPIRSIGWSKATDGAVTGPVVFLDFKTLADMDKPPSNWKGAILCLGSLSFGGTPSATPENAYDAVIPPARGVPKAPPFNFRKFGKMLQNLIDSGAAVVLMDSGKPNGLFNMFSFGPYTPSAVPTALLTHEDYDLLERLSKAGAGPITMKVNLKGTFSPGPVPAAITVAEIKGSKFPDERVIIGGHLDSWDLGQGSLDNGTGAMAVLEAARTLKALGWPPLRTITFVLFTGEEEGGIGADLFMKNHAAEIPKMDAALIHDTGTGKVLSIALEGLYSTAPQMTQIYLPIQEVFDLQPLSTRFFGASDHVAFLVKGVPAYFCIQAPAHYGEAHHSQADTFDLVVPDEINQGAGVLAAWAWNVSQLPEPFPHHAQPAERSPF